MLATIVKSDTVLVDFSMTALDYLKSKERNINLGQQDSTRSWQPNITIKMCIRDRVCTVIEELVESVDEMHEANYFLSLIHI